MHRRLVVVAAGDAGLVGNDEDMPAGLGGVTDRIARAVDPLEAVARADIAVIDVEHAVAVQEQALCGATARGISVCARAKSSGTPISRK